MDVSIRRTVCLLLAALLLALFCAAAAAESYTTLRSGSTGTAVVSLQQALKTAGFYTGSADGKYGPNTEAAVRRFQTAYRLSVDGVAGPATQNKLYSLVTPAVTAAPAATAAQSVSASVGGWFSGNYATLRNGSTGNRVKLLQIALRTLGYYNGSVDGKYGAGTTASVKAFQRGTGLTQDGAAGQLTLTRLEAGLGADNTAAAAALALGSASPAVVQPVPTVTAAPAVTPAPAVTGSIPARPTGTLRPGDRGSGVISLQTRLKQLGYYNGALDGIYGSGTTAAVTAFQRASRLTADGVAGSRTYAVLYAGSTAAAPVQTAAPAPVITPAPAVTGAVGPTLRSGSSGAAVSLLQTALRNLGYTVSATGTYDEQTLAAVRKFQSSNALAVDGVAGSQTQTVLYSGRAQGPSQIADTGKIAGPAVSQVQLLHWFNQVKPSLRSGQTILVYDPDTGYAWTLRLLSLGRHADAEPLTAEDTATMLKAFGGKNTWDQKAVYVRLPSGAWTLASTHDMPHLSGAVKDNNFNGHLCVHFLRDMDECMKNDPNYGVSNQKTIRTRWLAMTGQKVD